MSFTLRPKIFSLLLCSHVELDDTTGGWQLAPLNHVATRSLPLLLNVVLCANIMAPPEELELSFRIFHAEQPDGLPLNAPMRLRPEADKNVDFMARLALTLASTGLYLVEARLGDFDTAFTPLRVSLLTDQRL
ncbi:MAG: hypothetical protein SNJ58_01360 [Aggregatilineales bacterium]